MVDDTLEVLVDCVGVVVDTELDFFVGGTDAVVVDTPVVLVDFVGVVGVHCSICNCSSDCRPSLVSVYQSFEDDY